jgi:hypothetical protein
VSAFATIDAERIKLSTTRSPLWSAVAVAVLSLGLAALQAATAYGSVPPQKAALGVVVFGVPVLMILASMTVTGEYRSGLVNNTFMATPRRSTVLISKAVVSALFSGLYAALMVIASVVVAKQVADPVAASQLSLSASGTWRLAGATALYAMLAAVLGVGVGALLRFAAGAVAVLLLWPMVAEPLLGNLPNAGPEIGPWLPFANVYRFLDVSWLYPVYDVPWGEWGSLAYFAVVSAIVFGAALVVVRRRDA